MDIEQERPDEVFPAIDMANKNFREAWLEGAIKTALSDAREAMKRLEGVLIPADLEHPVRHARERLTAQIRHLEITVAKIDEGDLKRRKYWEDRRLASLAKAQAPLEARIAEQAAATANKLPEVYPMRDDDPNPAFLRS